MHVCWVWRPLGNTQFVVLNYELPPSQRYGASTRRPWRAVARPVAEAGTEIFPASNVSTTVDLIDEALMMSALERLTVAGIDLTGAPLHLDESLLRPSADR